MDYGIEDRRARVVGLPSGLEKACLAALRAEGAVAGSAHADTDILVAGWAGAPGSNLLDVDTADELHRAWDQVESSVTAYRAAMAGMEREGWGRLIWVGPAGAKSLDSHVDDLGAAASLAMLAANKLVTAEAGAANVTANAVLYGGGVADDDIASAVCFLCSEGAGYISGVTITVDGGAGSAMFA